MCRPWCQRCRMEQLLARPVSAPGSAQLASLSASRSLRRSRRVFASPADSPPPSSVRPRACLHAPARATAARRGCPSRLARATWQRYASCCSRGRTQTRKTRLSAPHCTMRRGRVRSTLTFAHSALGCLFAPGLADSCSPLAGCEEMVRLLLALPRAAAGGIELNAVDSEGAPSCFAAPSPDDKPCRPSRPA